MANGETLKFCLTLMTILYNFQAICKYLFCTNILQDPWCSLFDIHGPMQATNFYHNTYSLWPH